MLIPVRIVSTENPFVMTLRFQPKSSAISVPSTLNKTFTVLLPKSSVRKPVMGGNHHRLNWRVGDAVASVAVMIIGRSPVRRHS